MLQQLEDSVVVHRENPGNSATACCLRATRGLPESTVFEETPQPMLSAALHDLCPTFTLLERLHPDGDTAIRYVEGDFAARGQDGEGATAVESESNISRLFHIGAADFNTLLDDELLAKGVQFVFHNSSSVGSGSFGAVAGSGAGKPTEENVLVRRGSW